MSSWSTHLFWTIEISLLQKALLIKISVLWHLSHCLSCCCIAKIQGYLSSWFLVTCEAWILKSMLKVILDSGISQGDVYLPMTGDLPLCRGILAALRDDWKLVMVWEFLGKECLWWYSVKYRNLWNLQQF